MNFDEIHNRYKHLLICNSNNYPSSKINVLVLAGNTLVNIDQINNHCFGHISYDYKNHIENLSSKNSELNSFSDFSFVQPEYKLNLSELTKISHQTLPVPKVTFNPTTSKKEYLATISKIRNHIKIGDIYEINFCIGFKAENINVDPFSLYKELNNISPTPFSCFYKSEDNYLICASPERFLQKTNDKLLSQPIKGTIKRTKNQLEDQKLLNQLKNNDKDIIENTMVVDMVRNDLSRVAQKNSVKVEEFCKIYSFPQVHQMISTISCYQKKEASFKNIIRATFPMGSMTGTPKIRTMKLIEKYENQKRGLFSGTVGYIDGNGDFDFNVVIRSLFYNAKSKTLSFQVGGAITHKSDPEQEYEECLLKAKAIFDVFR